MNKKANIKRFMSLVLSLLLVSFVLAGCGSSKPAAPAPASPAAATPSATAAPTPKAKELVTLRVGVMPDYNSLGIIYAAKKGMYEKFGVKVEPITFQSGPPMNEAIGANKIDVGVMSAASVTAVGSYNSIIVGDICDQAGKIGFAVRKNGDIAAAKGQSKEYPEVLGSAESLKGKTFILQLATGAQIVLDKWLGLYGLTEKDVKIVNMPFAQAYQAYLAGTGDAVCVLTRIAYDVVNSKDSVMACDMTSIKVQNYGTVVENPKTYANPQTREAVVNFLAATLKANDVLAKDRELAITTLADWFRECGVELKKEQVAFEVDSQKLFTTDIAKANKLGSSTQLTAEFMASIGSLEKDKLQLMYKNLDDGIWQDAIKAASQAK